MTNKNEKYVVTRARLTGVLCGYLVESETTVDEVVLREVRQIWRFGGCETVAGLAHSGASMIEMTRIDKPAPIGRVQREPGFAIFECTPEAEANLRQSRWL